MNGEIDFAEALRERVALLRGLPLAALEQTWDGVRLTPGAQDAGRDDARAQRDGGAGVAAGSPSSPARVAAAVRVRRAPGQHAAGRWRGADRRGGRAGAGPRREAGRAAGTGRGARAAAGGDAGGGRWRERSGDGDGGRHGRCVPRQAGGGRRPGSGWTTPTCGRCCSRRATRPQRSPGGASIRSFQRRGRRHQPCPVLICGRFCRLAETAPWRDWIHGIDENIGPARQGRCPRPSRDPGPRRAVGSGPACCSGGASDRLRARKEKAAERIGAATEELASGVAAGLRRGGRTAAGAGADRERGGGSGGGRAPVAGGGGQPGGLFASRADHAAAGGSKPAHCSPLWARSAPGSRRWWLRWRKTPDGNSAPSRSWKAWSARRPKSARSPGRWATSRNKPTCWR